MFWESPFYFFQKGILEVRKYREIQISALGFYAEKKLIRRKEIMKTIVFNHGFNRVEHRQIINIERAKLNHLLNEERRIVENLTKSAQTEIQINPQILRSVEAVWKRIANHRLVREIRRRVDCLTDAYPQFLRQVETVRTRLQEKFFAIINEGRFAAQNCLYQSR